MMARKQLSWRPALLTIAVLGVAAPHAASAQNFFDFLFNGGQPQKPQRQQRAPEPSPIESFFADPFGTNQQPAPPPRAVSTGGSGPAFCVRTCDGKYFPLSSRVNASPVQMCQAFCPASPTKIYFGSNIENASSATGERYADSETAFAYRKALKADCTCNGRSAAGLAPVDLSMDMSLKAGDVVATTNGLAAYTGARLGMTQTPDFTPVAAFPGLTADVRAKLGEMKVAPVTAELVDSSKPVAIELPPVTAQKAGPKAKRADLRSSSAKE
jgi:hypothetical protein